MLLPTATPAPVSALVPVQAHEVVLAPLSPTAPPVPVTRRLAMPVLAAGLVGCLALYGAIAFALLHVAIGLFV